MTRGIGIAGRQALDLAQHVTDAQRTERVPSSAPSSVDNSPSPLMRQEVTQSPIESGDSNASTTAGANPAASEIERETPSPSPEDVAERVYHIFCETLRLERERRGRWG